MSWQAVFTAPDSLEHLKDSEPKILQVLGMEANDYLTPVFLDCSHPCTSWLELGYNAEICLESQGEKDNILFGNV